VGDVIMNESELEYYRLVLKKMEKHKKSNPKLYINDDYEYVMKEEVKVSNDVYKGVIMFKNDNNYLIDIYVSAGEGSIITGLLFKEFKDYSLAVISYNDEAEYIKNSSIMELLKKGEKNFKN
jgi:hypothetical protein